MRVPPWRGEGSLDETHLAVDLLDDRTFALVETRLVLLEQIVALGIDGDDQRAELTDPVDPQGFRHAEILPFGPLDFLDLGGRQYRTTAGEYRMHGLVFQAASGGFRAHTALADDQLDAGLFDELLLELFHAHAGGRADG